MSKHRERNTPWLLWPFVVLWDVLAFILTLTGRMLGIILGLVLMVVGIILTVTVIAAPVGIPLIIFGLALMLRGLF